MSSQEQAPQPAPDDDGWEWAMVEIFGHRRHAGRCREIEKFGAKLLRVDIPVKGDAAANGWETHCYGGSSIFSYTPTDEASVMRANKPYDPMASYRLPAPGTSADAAYEGDDDHGDDPDDEPF